MHIIFGKDNAKDLGDKYTLLPVDQFQVGDSGPVIQAYAVIENIPIMDLPLLSRMTQLHHALMENYGQKQWSECIMLIGQLRGYFGPDMDTFYDNLEQRVLDCQTHVAEDWTPVLVK